ncbi:thioredoxin family protein [Sporobolomyces koalae]|uniref:thioredoxin family protein n=1 Tax=Sporobolomyces koalae TaxID=500713 RepID=UPI0031815733
MFRLSRATRVLERTFATSARQQQILPGTAEAFQKHAIDGTKPVLVDFYADWCGPCRFLTPILEKVVTDETGVDLMKVDTEKEFELAQKYKIRSLPTVMAFKNGQVVGQFIGAQQEGGVRKFLDEIKSK